MEWNNAIEARAACDSLFTELGQIPHNPDLKKYLRNIDAQVTELSRKEVIARRHKTNAFIAGDLARINDSLNYLRNLILVARLAE